MNILEVKNLNIGFNMYDKLLNQKLHQMVFDLNVTIKKGEILAIAGSSGSGKSLMAHAILGILPKNAVVSAEIKFKNEIVDENRLSQLRGKEITFVPQSIAYLDPLMTIEDQLMRKDINKQDFFKVMDTLGFTKADLGKYPFQLSGGMARRVLIANTILSKADLIIADEPTPGLSLDLAIEVLNHFRNMANDGKGILLITHDIDLVCNVADKMAIFYGGHILETLNTKDFLKGEKYIRHPLTKAFWRALPQNDFEETDMEDIRLQCKKLNLELPSLE
ncbi:Glutathione import ATP-binding protein GsiA [Fusobacterium polymorphum]|uniref:Nickel import system ATP-binding protein NikD n=1 Tax=Fusobacterium polymorphum ATCC 10953 TaxID=393480 RepID=A5TTC5_FUSNP|nr:ABC transporter ATP-binding protein [Fusobacterium polymorphum]EDK88150.1 possible dipeptide/oligopeptide/nickel (Ni2+) ABC superfamily ATP binding cassette transporter membrane protein [Fusobacterium polymorphum ATCC 10953]UTI53736.1 ABC transporter ATP-binding protein [Fusobacterium polymorphum]WRL68270.1 ABC transporter ATP-binding protein [Fusobacterium polymorphum]CKG79805.1 Glutathione import ATP-binding protein GsiA [Fusobacterium polymorphum]